MTAGVVTHQVLAHAPAGKTAPDDQDGIGQKAGLFSIPDPHMLRSMNGRRMKLQPAPTSFMVWIRNRLK